MKSEPKAFASLSSGLLARKGSARPAMRPQGFGQGGSGLEDLGWNDMGYEAPRPTLTPVEGAGAGVHVEPQVSRNPLAGLTPVSPVHDQQAELEERLGHFDESEEEWQGEEQACESFVQGYSPEPEPTDFEEALDLEDELPEAMPARVSTPELSAPAPVIPLIRSQPEPEADYGTEVEPAPTPAPKRSRASRAQQSAKEKAAFTLRLDPNRHLKLRLACAVNAKSAQQLVTKALDQLLASMPELDAMASKAPGKANQKD